MQIVSNIALISINETLFAQLISFLIFLFIINRIMFRPLNATMSERDEFIQGLSQSITTTEIEVEEMLADLKQRETAVKKEAYDLSATIEQEGSEKAGGIQSETMAAIAELRQKTEKQVQEELEEAKKHLEAESEALAVRIMEKVLNRRLSS
jgi:F-type H+-transporting ATPase subunit b